MSLNRIVGILLQEFYITKRSLEVIMDLFFFSIMNILVFGFIATFLFGSKNSIAGAYLLLGLLLWEVIRINQYSMSVGSLWNVWSKNLSNMFVAPMSLTDYLIAHMVSGVAKSLFIFLIISFMSISLFKFNVFDIGLNNLSASFINLIIFSWSVGIIILGIIFRYGTRIQAFAWGLIFLFQPLTAAFFPLKILPIFIQKISYAFPATYVFEAARGNLSDKSFNWSYQGIAFAENIFYFLFSLWLFNLLFRRSKETGQFASNEG
ncbi:MAG: hypothetical protein A2Z11_02165 [Candidatus Woykebacteria bacterium RBG_16_43_9]|uniref:ABC-2 type transporter transmembrane domain-containing protein n=1 Tax=Candidatus Woykebacteria bacterium RBG_16_43_9 TaxID=1802596 RepID=A0A1G1WHN7_9BACT|nr:MAG: hypothetical protein A2Z11_02165 [Candidatus Woykebacteria bacterium RBG_16_43_9]